MKLLYNKKDSLQNASSNNLIYDSDIQFPVFVFIHTHFYSQDDNISFRQVASASSYELSVLSSSVRLNLISTQ